MIIDIHAHFIPRVLFERFDARHAEFPGVHLLRDGNNVRIAFLDGEPTRPISPKLSDLDDRRAWMDKNGIDHQLIGGWLDSFGYELPRAEGKAWSRFINECMLDALKDEPRFTPLATVPLQNGEDAAEVLEEAMAAGFGGLMIGTLPQGLGGVLDGPDLDPFWAAASRLGAAVVLHPMFLCGEPRLADYDLVNAIGRLADTSIAVSRLLFSGHLLKYTGLKLVLSHGGAALPYALGRLARNFAIGGGKYADPRKGYGTLYFDSVVFDPEALEFLARTAGADRVMLGSDMPFPIGDPAPLDIIRNGDFTEEERGAMLSRTARNIFRVKGCDC
ncbi:amidohydrolase family protein [Pigmentiphaga soli]|uniref:Amidohydrolase family protein n=1 Tax=Pigmentiphaga soli TaxID=1007095 RepID=A0ABP8GTD7_9BURK